MLDEEFLSDIIAKLPGPRNKKDRDGPYELQKTLLLKELEMEERLIAGVVEAGNPAPKRKVNERYIQKQLTNRWKDLFKDKL